MRFYINGIKLFESQCTSFIFHPIFTGVFYQTLCNFFLRIYKHRFNDMAKPLKNAQKTYCPWSPRGFEFLLLFLTSESRRLKAFKIRNEETTMRVIQGTRGWPLYSS